LQVLDSALVFEAEVSLRTLTRYATPTAVLAFHCVNRAAPGTALHKGDLADLISGASGIIGNSKWEGCFISWQTDITFFAGDKGVSTYRDEASQVE